MPKPKPASELASPAPFRLCNAFAKLNKKSITLFEKCYFTLPPHIHTYFFRRLFAGRRGIYQELTSTYYAKLYEACQAAGLVGERAIWDASNEQIVAEILSKLNFNDNRTNTSDSQLRSTVPDTKRSSGKRRTAKGSDEPKR